MELNSVNAKNRLLLNAKPKRPRPNSKHNRISLNKLYTLTNRNWLSKLTVQQSSMPRRPPNSMP